MSEAVRQCADALMLSGESAMGPYGQKAISVLSATSTRMELWSREVNQQRFLPQLGNKLPDQIAEQICNCAGRMGTFSFFSAENVDLFTYKLVDNIKQLTKT